MNSKLPETRAQRIGRILSILREIDQLPVEEIATYLGISSEDWRKFETGELSPSLPQLESLANFFQISLDILLKDLPEGVPEKIDPSKIAPLHSLRDRIIAVTIKRARLEQNRTQKDLAVSLDTDEATIAELESGKISIPLPDLEVICSELGISLKSLVPGQELQSQQEMSNTPAKSEQPLPLPPELYTFVSNSSNLPYLHLAKKLSEMDAHKLRGIAEGLLEITY